MANRQVLRNHIQPSCLKDKKSGADMKRVVIQVYLRLKDLGCGSKILLLFQTIIKIGKISYSRDNTRLPKQLFSCILAAGYTWNSM